MEDWKMVKTLLAVFILLSSVACAQRSHYVSPVPSWEPCAHIDPLFEKLKHLECKYDSVPTMYDIQQANQQGYDNVRRQVRRRWRRSAFNNPYLRYDELQNFHEQSDKDHHE
jgi:hypothetical protein